MSLYQFDIRGFIGDIELGDQRWTQPFAFVDAGNVYDKITDIAAAHDLSMKVSYGGGVVLMEPQHHHPRILGNEC